MACIEEKQIREDKSDFCWGLSWLRGKCREIGMEDWRLKDHSHNIRALASGYKFRRRIGTGDLWPFSYSTVKASAKVLAPILFSGMSRRYSISADNYSQVFPSFVSKRAGSRSRCPWGEFIASHAPQHDLNHIIMIHMNRTRKWRRRAVSDTVFVVVII